MIAVDPLPGDPAGLLSGCPVVVAANNCVPGTKRCFNVPQLCANVPTSPPGASATFNTNLVNQSTQAMWPATKLDYFYQTFRTGGTFDYKATGGDQYVGYGNWNFGYVQLEFRRRRRDVSNEPNAVTSGYDSFVFGVSWMRLPTKHDYLLDKSPPLVQNDPHGSKLLLGLGFLGRA